jgi:HptB-dependent secretion and biofilm anti anti-sigma factor
MLLNFGAATETSIIAMKETNSITLPTAEILDFSACQEFWLASQQARGKDARFIIDMEQTTVIRDSGYAMLLMLGEGVSSEQTPITIVNCNLRLQKELQGRGFDQYFTFYDRAAGSKADILRL